MTISKAVLITGCSSGIGDETARHLAARGWTVYATARRPETLADLEAAGCKTLACDVTDEASMRGCVDAVVAAEGAVGVLVNNAGYSQSGAVESVDMDSIRRQFETNVFGLIRMSQLVLPGMRDQRWGRIVNISSMGGRLTFPGGGIYHATKHAVEAICDAMRFEVAGFGVDVVCVEPGLIVTGFGDAAARSLEDGHRGGGPIRRVQRARRRGDGGGLQGADAPSGWGAGDRRKDDREGDHRAPAAVPIQGHAVGEAGDRAAPSGQRQALGSGDGSPVSAARGLTKRQPVPD